MGQGEGRLRSARRELAGGRSACGAGKAAKPHTSVNAAVSSLEQQPWEAVGTLDVKQPAGAVHVKDHDCLPVGCQEGGLRPTEPPPQTATLASL